VVGLGVRWLHAELPLIQTHHHSRPISKAHEQGSQRSCHPSRQLGDGRTNLSPTTTDRQKDYKQDSSASDSNCSSSSAISKLIGQRVVILFEVAMRPGKRRIHQALPRTPETLAAVNMWPLLSPRCRSDPVVLPALVPHLPSAGESRCSTGVVQLAGV